MSGIHFDAGSHTYTHRGVKLNSVTRILAHAGIIDASYAGGVEYLDRGNKIHDLTARYDTGEKIDLRKLEVRWRGHYKAWLRFRLETGFTPSLIEHRVSKIDPNCTHKSGCQCYVGTLDRLGSFTKSAHKDSLLTLLDIKNCKTGPVGDWVRYQLVGYGHAYNPSKLYHRVGVALHADGTYKMTGDDKWPLNTWAGDLEKFLRANRETTHGKQFGEFLRPRR